MVAPGVRSPRAVLTAFILLCTALSARAGIDLNGNGMSDIWELEYGAQTLNPQLDSDGDGLTNLQESLAGTNPLSAASRFSVTRVDSVTGGIKLYWPSVAGKVYHVYSAGNLKNWNPTGDDIAGTGGELQSKQTPNNNPKFYRVQVSDVDSDNDGLSDWEEIQLGWNPNNPSTDGQQNDFARAVAGLQATSNTIAVRETDPAWTPYSATPGTFVITRTGRLDALTINLQFSGTAQPGLDYQSLPATVSLPLGASSVVVTVAPLNSSTHTVVAGIIPGVNYQAGSPTFSHHDAGPRTGRANRQRAFSDSIDLRRDQRAPGAAAAAKLRRFPEPAIQHRGHTDAAAS